MNDYLITVLTTGSRTWDDVAAIHDVLLDTWHDARQDGWPGIEVLEGGATGADSIVAAWTRQNAGDGVGHQRVPANWSGPCTDTCPPDHRRTAHGTTYCPLAGHRRNQQMVDAGPALCLAFRRGKSTGTADCIRRAKAAGIPVREVTAA